MHNFLLSILCIKKSVYLHCTSWHQTALNEGEILMSMPFVFTYTRHANMDRGVGWRGCHLSWAVTHQHTNLAVYVRDQINPPADGAHRAQRGQKPPIIRKQKKMFLFLNPGIHTSPIHFLTLAHALSLTRFVSVWDTHDGLLAEFF